jgi:hypothetical protein
MMVFLKKASMILLIIILCGCIKQPGVIAMDISEDPKNIEIEAMKKELEDNFNGVLDAGKDIKRFFNSLLLKGIIRIDKKDPRETVMNFQKNLAIIGAEASKKERDNLYGEYNKEDLLGFYNSIQYRDINAIKKYLESGGNPDHGYYELSWGHGNPLWHIALSATDYNGLDIMKLLIDFGANEEGMETQKPVREKTRRRR